MSTYDRIGRTYARTRRPDPRIARQIAEALGDARSVVNVGAGTGAYEPRDRDVVAVEPSSVMLRQRPPDAAPAVQGSAEEIPFADGAFDAALAVLTMHHWSDWRAGVDEMRRVARRRIVMLTFDPDYISRYWLVRDYLPEIAVQDEKRFPPLAVGRRGARRRAGDARADRRRTAPTASSAGPGSARSRISTRRCARTSRASRCWIPPRSRPRSRVSSRTSPTARGPSATPT